jgi:hypothetical protein
MKSRKYLLSFLVACCSPLYWAAPARALALPPVPGPPSSDAWLSFNGNNFVGPFDVTEAQEEPNGSLDNTGIPTASPNGIAVELTETPSPFGSDYVYAVNNFLYFSSDSEAGNVTIHPAILGGVAGLTIVASLPETGNWQEIDQYFVGTPPAWVQSDLDVPEPVSGMVLGSAFGLLALRRRI